MTTVNGKLDFETLVEFLRSNNDRVFNRENLIEGLKSLNKGSVNDIIDACFVRSDRHDAQNWLAFFLRGKFFGEDIYFSGACKLEIMDADSNPKKVISGHFFNSGTSSDPVFVFKTSGEKVIEFNPYNMRLIRS